MRARSFHLPPTIDNIEQINCTKLLGVLFQSKCKIDMHVQNLLSQCTQRLYLIKLLKYQGMPEQQLSVVTYCTPLLFRVFYTPSQLGEAS